MRRLTLHDMRVLAKQNQGLCLSKNYRDTQTKMVWRCSKGHEWRSLPSSVKQGHWCGRCFDDKRRGNIDRVQAYAHSHNGECLTKKFKNIKTHLRFRCAFGHIWRATFNGMLSQKSWCRICSGTAKHKLSTVRAFAKTRGGRCLSKNYKNAITKLSWQCSEGHKWNAKFNSIKNGSWCPYCSNYLRERIVRKIFENLFMSDFPRVRPLWLKNTNGFALELDGYNPKLKLAFEHQGEQHYRVVSGFAGSSKDFSKRKIADKTKRNLCRRNLVKLILVPFNVPIKNLTDFIKSECKKSKINIPHGRVVNISEAYPNPIIRELKEIAKSRKGRCLSKQYEGSEVKLIWECSKKHRWSAFPYKIRGGEWCGKCGLDAYHKPQLERMFKKLCLVVKNKGGKCLTRIYTNSQTPLLLSCKFGHQWHARPANVIHHGSWCPKCWRVLPRQMS